MRCDRFVRIQDSIALFYVARLLVAGAVIALVASLSACERSVGIGGDDSGTGQQDAGVDAEADARATDANTGEFLQGIVGWRAEAFEHTTFVPEAVVEEAQLDLCDPYLTAVEGEERWWAIDGGWPDTRPYYPTAQGPQRVGLMVVSGWLSPPGTYGHDDWFQREFELTEWELLLCPTVERLRHCVVPQPGDFCQLPDEPWFETREDHLARVLSGPGDPQDSYQLTVTYNPNIMDGTTVFHLAFTLPPPENPPQGEWEAFDLQDVGGRNISEERLWIGYELIPYPHEHDGWVMRNLAADTLRVSLSARNDYDEPVHIWGDFPVDEVIAYP